MIGTEHSTERAGAEPANARILIVTGGSRGIGFHVARLAACQGWQVAVGYHRHRPELDHSQPWSRSIHPIELDVRDPASQSSFFAQAEQTLGRPSALVTSAGIDRGAIPIERITHEDLTETFAVNAIGLITSCSEFVRRAALSHGGNGGVIVNVSSMAATIGGRRHKTIYAATKAAVDAFTIGAAKELAREAIRVFSVRPGMTRTDMTAQVLSDPDTAAAIRATIACGREATVEEIAEPILDLLSGRFAYASGSTFNLSGGGFVL